MFLLVEIDRNFAGFKINWLKGIKGVCLGFIAINIFHGITFENFLELAKMKYHRDELEKMNAELAEKTEELRKEHELLSSSLSSQHLQ